ncbi:MAG: type IX secretion system membrane protein PorP/SprF [Bacteroidetes bacterium]|nr:type IX secretion system membrane protein PorP/SprF [Bacteroidota bacterium]
MKKYIIFVLMLVSMVSYGQDPQFTQFYASPLYLNPAFAGTARCPRVMLNYRNQWPALNRAFVTYAASYDQHFDVLSGGIGLILLKDDAGEGTINTTSASFMYSYQANLSRKFSIKAALQATYMQKRINWDKLTFGDMIDPRYGFVYETQEVRPNESKGFADFSAGILGYSEKFYGGLAVHHLTQPDEAFIVNGASALPMKSTAHVGLMLPIAGSSTYGRDKDDGTYLSPNLLYQQQRSFNQLNVGMYFLKSPFVGGLWYRGSFGKEVTSDAVMALVGLQKGMFKVGYSYDVTISKLSNASGGSHEVSVGIQFYCRPKKKRFRTISCPTF